MSAALSIENTVLSSRWRERAIATAADVITPIAGLDLVIVYELTRNDDCSMYHQLVVQDGVPVAWEVGPNETAAIHLRRPARLEPAGFFGLLPATISIQYTSIVLIHRNRVVAFPPLIADVSVAFAAMPEVAGATASLLVRLRGAPFGAASVFQTFTDGRVTEYRYPADDQTANVVVDSPYGAGLGLLTGALTFAEHRAYGTSTWDDTAATAIIAGLIGSPEYQLAWSGLEGVLSFARRLAACNASPSYRRWLEALRRR